MRLTVGPLPPAVYWRRRAVVLGAVLLFLVVLLYSCVGQDGTGESGKDRTAGPGKSTGASPALTPEIGGSPSPGTESGAPEPGGPGGGESPAPAEGGDAPGGGQEDTSVPVGGGQMPEPPPPVQNECTDEEISVVPVPERNSVQQGASINLQITIKNLSGRTCNRDVGADPQELYLKLGAQKVWSSDTCARRGTVPGNDVRPFPPGHVKTYTVSWNGRRSSECGDGVATGPSPDPGTYQLFGRLGNKLSDPVRLTITG